MILAVCLDDNNGMSFLGKRQSRDRAVYADIVKRSHGNTIYLDASSVKLFAGMDAEHNELDGTSAPHSEGVYFAENDSFLKDISSYDQILIYRWNRLYPSDLRFPETALRGFTLADTEEFEGSSHERITVEVYCRESFQV